MKSVEGIVMEQHDLSGLDEGGREEFASSLTDSLAQSFMARIFDQFYHGTFRGYLMRIFCSTTLSFFPY